MKKRLLSLLLAVCLAASVLALPVSAAETVRFSDVTDRDTAMAVESLRLLGVLDGYGDGSFRPNAVLTRAQFCKMAVYAMDGESELGLYRTVTVFPDVKPSHWASAYINMAAKGKGVIAGYADGRFHPEKTVTVGQAVTILLRLLGYTDENVGGIWPHGYMAVAQTIGLTDGVSGDGYTALTRGQAARLFLNLLRSDMREGGKYLDTLGTTVPNTMLVSASATGPDGRDNALQTAGGEVYQLASGKASNGLLNGYKGTLLLNKYGKALTFVPDALGSSRTVILASKTATQIVDAGGVKYTLKASTPAYYNGEESDWGDVYSWLHAGMSVTLYLSEAGSVDYVFVGGGTVTAAVIVDQDRSGAGFDSLTGGMTGYAIYKNGAPATLGDLRKYDVAVYSAAENAIRVCDTRVTVYYESCYPNPAEPTTITVLNGTELTVLPTAMESLSAFKPGQRMTLLLTEDGQVAGAVDTGSGAKGNAVGIVSGGKVQLLCGTAKILLDAGASGELEGQLVRVSAGSKGKVDLSRLSGGASGELSVSGRTLGKTPLADNVMVFRDGEDISLSQLTHDRVGAGDIRYARTNWAGQVDLIVLGGSESGTVYYGVAVVKRSEFQVQDENGRYPGDDGYVVTTKTTQTIAVEYGTGLRTEPIQNASLVANGAFVEARIKDGRITSLETLTKLSNVPNSAWSGKTAVTVGGRTYTVPEDVACYNSAAKSWLTLSQAHGYADTANLYVSDGVVRVIEVGK
ncbi:S-layer homology domain-containing protein [Dysosmobacter sp. Sow4_B12]|uniref:S-layer homology domain-containing protein n=1 Tax=Dysosmobacter sp. Sow4_B12 TaxID=3438777 RepID=UPI003F8E2C80